MKALRMILAGVIFVIACPISWIGAWITGTWFTVVLSMALPTYGGIYWALSQVMETSFLHSLLSWSLGFVGAFVTLGAIYALLKEPR